MGKSKKKNIFKYLQLIFGVKKKILKERKKKSKGMDKMAKKHLHLLSEGADLGIRHALKH